MEHATWVGARIRACRLAKGLTAGALATRAGVTENAIRKIESGDSKEPRFSTGVRIAHALGVDANELLGAADVHSSPPNLALVLRLIRSHRGRLSSLGISHASVFGSVARGDATGSSDIDIVVEPAPERRLSLFDLEEVQQVLEDLLTSRVDVITTGTLLRSQSGRTALEEAVNAF